METAPTTSDQIRDARRRACVAFLSVAVGLTLAGWLPHAPSWAWFAAGLVIALAALFRHPGVTRVALAGGLAAIAGGWLTLRVYEPPIDSLASTPSDTPITLRGLALTSPRESPRETEGLARFVPRTARWRFEFDANTIETQSGPQRVSGRVWVRVAGESQPPVRAGERVRISGTLSRFGPPSNPGEDDIRLTAAQREFVGTLGLPSAELIAPDLDAPSLASRARSTALRARAWLQDRAGAAVDRAAGEDDPQSRFLLRALLLGDYDSTQRPLREAFARQGLAHALSISGFHLAVMAAVMLFLIRLSGDRGWLEPTMVAALVVLYALIVPPSSPILRSAAMVLVLLLAEAFGRRYDRVTLLGWVAIALLAWRPLDLWSLGYQLSVGLTATLLWLGERYHAAFWHEELKGLLAPREPDLWRAVKTHLKTSVSSAVLCWLVSTPVLLHTLGLVSPLGVLATIVVTPILVLALWVAYAAVIAGMFVPPAAGLSTEILGVLSHSSVSCVQYLDSWPASSLRLPPVSAWWALAATTVVVAWARWGSLRDWRWLALLCGCLAWLGAEWSFAGRLGRDVAVRIDTFDVGDGTCHLIRSGNDALLWDAGGQPDSGLQSELVQSCRALGVWRVPTLVISHPDIDHFGAVERLIEPLGVRRALVPERFAKQARDKNSAAGAAFQVLERAGVEIIVVGAGDSLALGTCDVEILSPPPDADWPKDNDHSIVAAIADASRPDAPMLLMTGDIEDASVGRLLQGPVRADVLELPHHGSARAAAMDFTRELNPAVVLQSTGRGRAHDPRWNDAREGRAWLSTAERGWCWAEIRLDGKIRWGASRE
ncbi:ComE operon protein 3 [Phycisphaerales bacterium]|nr:ComE operon protein 3 [Phycisphaerales bacterium]